MYAPLTAEQRLDLRTVSLPGTMSIRGLDRRRDFEQTIKTLVAQLAAQGKISDPKEGFGFATTGVVPLRHLLEVNLESPLDYIQTAFASGNVPVRYPWNAVRKIYELLRLIKEGHDVGSTLEVVQNHPELLRPAVPSENPDGSIPWGPFSWGGAVILKEEARSIVGGKSLTMAAISSFSVWKQEEDDEVAKRAAKWQLSVSR